jgi:uncharacterized protein YndB with AHSA1/START domain
MHVENTITIERPIEEFFEYVSTPENDPTWVSVSTRNQRTLPGPMRVRMTMEEDVKIFGRTSRDTWEGLSSPVNSAEPLSGHSSIIDDTTVRPMERPPSQATGRQRCEGG